MRLFDLLYEKNICLSIPHCQIFLHRVQVWNKRDIYNEECEKKLLLQSDLLGILKGYGYHPIQTPTFEFFDIFGKEIGTTPSKELYKFFDREGNTLVLRPDMTPSIARAAAKYFLDEGIFQSCLLQAFHDHG